MSDAANNQYRYAAELAQDANHAAEKGRELHEDYSDQSKRKVQWDRTIAPSRATVVAFVILFPVIAIVEYLFSEELYRDVLPRHPWAMGLIFAVLAIVIAELIVYRFFEAKRQWKANELKRSDSWKDQPDEVINKQVVKITQRQLVIGIVLFITMVGILSYMSWDRVVRLIAAGERTNPFGPIDLLPMILYVFEVFTGMFIWYIILRLFLGVKVKSLKRDFDAAVRACSELTIDAVQAFNKAEGLGYNIFQNPVTKSIQEAFCRNDALTEARGSDYIKEQTIAVFPVQLRLLHLGSNDPVIGNVQVGTDYKFSSATGTADGNLNFNVDTFLRLSPEVGNKTEDSIRTIKVEYQTNGVPIRKEKNVAIDIDAQGPHTIFL
jgi:hypothetical protein